MTTVIYSHPDCKKHEMGPHHPENPQRIQVIEDHLILNRMDAFLEYRDAPIVNIEDIERVHTHDAIAFVRDNVPKKPGVYFSVDSDTHLNMFSWQAALRAAGAAVAATDAVIAGEMNNAFCLVRPIGHHACSDDPMGFCLFNNIAIAARRALEVHGLQRVAIVDFDVHHGNGTEAIFADDLRVMMVSFFQYPCYPYSDSTIERVNMVNVPVSSGANGKDVRKLVMEKWLPALHEHRPQMIFISAGFDAHREDILGRMELVEDDYAWITQEIMNIANQYAQGRIVSFLEGGYSLSALARSAVAHIKVLSGLG